MTRARSGLVHTLGLPSLRTRTLVLSTSEIRRGLRNSLGGSFDGFFSEVLASAMADRGNESGAEAGDENPFTRALEALKENAPLESAEKPVEQKASPPEKTTPAAESGVNPLASSPADTIAAGVTTNRPYLILSVGEGNVFRSVAASQPREGTFESAEFGLTDFRVFPMTDAAEFPLAMAVADFNGDSYADLVVHVPQQRLLRFFYQNPDGDFQEGIRIEAGGAPLSLAAGDFNRDGFVDLAFSHLGTGLLTVIYADANQAYRYFRTFASDVYRDYIVAADTSGTGNTELLAMNFANYATVLVDFAEPAGEIPGKRIEYARGSQYRVSSRERAALTGQCSSSQCQPGSKLRRSYGPPHECAQRCRGSRRLRHRRRPGQRRRSGRWIGHPSPVAGITEHLNHRVFSVSLPVSGARRPGSSAISSASSLPSLFCPSARRPYP